MFVGERDVLPFVRDHVDGLRLPGDRLALATDNATRREAIIARRERYATMFGEGDITPERWRVEKERADTDLGALDDTQTAVDLPTIDWTWPPEDVNRLLRRLIDHVDLGADLRPLRVVWRGRIAEWAR